MLMIFTFPGVFYRTNALKAVTFANNPIIVLRTHPGPLLVFDYCTQYIDYPQCNTVRLMRKPIANSK